MKLTEPHRLKIQLYGDFPQDLRRLAKSLLATLEVAVAKTRNHDFVGH
jgi:hypothetical protein